MKTSDVARHRGFESHPLRHRKAKGLLRQSFFGATKEAGRQPSLFAYLVFVLNVQAWHLCSVSVKHCISLMLFFAMLDKMLDAGNGLGDFGNRGGVGTAYIALAALSKGIAWHECHMLLHEQLFGKFLGG